VYLVDMEGKIAHKWNVGFYDVWGDKPTHIPQLVAEDNTYIAKAYAYPDGDLLVLYQGMAMPYGFGLAKVDKNSHVIWKYEAAAHHDFYVAEDGYIYTLIHNFYDAAEDKENRLPYPLSMELPHTLLEDSIAVLSPDGKEVSRTSLMGAIANSAYAGALLHGRGDLDYMDVTHANAVMKLEPSIAAKFPQFQAGQVLVSLRNMSALAVIDTTQHKLVWFQKGIWQYQHDAAFQPDGSILMLDNLGQMVQGESLSRLLKILPSTSQATWDYSGLPHNPFFTYGGGRVQLLPNNNILVAETLNGHVFEIDTAGKVVWDYIIPLYYTPRARGFPPYGDGKKRNVQTGFGALKPNLVTAITSARRYKPEEVGFLNTDK
jgi:hypothetical protein